MQKIFGNLLQNLFQNSQRDADVHEDGGGRVHDGRTRFDRRFQIVQRKLRAGNRRKRKGKHSITLHKKIKQTLKCLFIIVVGRNVNITV